MIPKGNPYRAHLPWDDPRVDTVYVLAMALKHPSKLADMNACSLRDADACIHWPDGPVKNHFDWLWIGKYDSHGREIRRPLTRTERNTPMIEWHAEKFLRLRRAEHGGRKPALVGTIQARAKRLGVGIAWEVKSRQYKDPFRAYRFVKAVKAAGGTYYFMTLVELRYWYLKMKAFKLAGGQTALLPHGERLTATRRVLLRTYRQYIDRIWGSWA